jgi:outer membrane biosynthesis protein TonB
MNYDEDRQICEAFYSRAIASATSDEEELAIALALLEDAEKSGAVPDDEGQELIRLGEYTQPVNAPWMIDPQDSTRQKLRRAVPVLAVMLLAFIAILVSSGGLGGAAKPAATPTTTAVTAVAHLTTQTLTPLPTTPTTPTTPATHTPTPPPSPTPLPTETRLPTETPSPVPPQEVEVKPEPVKLDAEAVIPVSLEIAGRYFPVVPTTLRDETWACLPDPDRASWLAGSYVNVVLSLPYTPDNLDLLSSLALSDTLTLRNNAARANLYRVVDRHQVDVYQIEALSQHLAGLTLVLVGGSEETPDRRLVIWAVPAEQNGEQE